jgi:hypothetical protein
MLNRSVPSFFRGNAATERPFCANREALLIRSLLESDKPGFDLGTFACRGCTATESIIVSVSPSPRRPALT